MSTRAVEFFLRHGALACDGLLFMYTVVVARCSSTNVFAFALLPLALLRHYDLAEERQLLLFDIGMSAYRDRVLSDGAKCCIAYHGAGWMSWLQYLPLRYHA